MDILNYSLLGYCVISLVFFIFPFKKPKTLGRNKYFQKYFTKKSIMHISHRGGARENLENTFQAFEHAVKQGTNCLEMDVCFTKDKKVVVIHDSFLGRICGVDAYVEQYNYKELPPILDRVRLDFAPNDYIDSSNCKTKYLPLFEDILKQFPNVLINVELKTPTQELIQAVSKLIKQYDREQTIIWGAKFQQGSDDMYKVNPNIPRFFSMQRVLKLYLFYLTGLLPFVDIQEDSLQIPLYTEDFYKCKLSYANTTSKKIGTVFFHTYVWLLGLISSPLFYHLGKRGIFVVFWVLNNELEYDQALKRGVHGIMTDSPTLLRNYLVSKNKLNQ